ncbi:MAG: response regulator transcription factor [Verrucomicrobiales bacterium]|nr:response regulator transcription factor [Verrucomicrobiales bacterium]
MHRVLIVEDDPTLLRGVTDNFAAKGYGVDNAMDGESAIEKALRDRPDLIVLDVMLPKVNGYEVCRYLRQEGFSHPIIFLTAKGEESDILLGLGLGGDDYLAKPFSVRELLARAEAVLRRQNAVAANSGDSNAFGGFRLDPGARRLLDLEGEPLKLSPKEYELLHFFLQHRGEALSRERIMDEVWGYGSRVTLRSVDRFVTSLRKVIESHQGEFIETIREYGYRFRRDGGETGAKPA